MIIKVKWIYRYQNSADFMTKTKLLVVLKIFIGINHIKISIIK